MPPSSSASNNNKASRLEALEALKGFLGGRDDPVSHRADVHHHRENTGCPVGADGPDLRVDQTRPEANGVAKKRSSVRKKPLRMQLIVVTDPATAKVRTAPRLAAP